MNVPLTQKSPIALDLPRTNLTERAAQLLNPAIFYALLILIVLVAIPYGTVEPLWQGDFECSVFALVALFIIEGLLSGTWRVKGGRLLAPLLALTFFAALQSLPWGSAGATAGIEVHRAVSADPYQTRLFALMLLALTLFLGLLMRYTSSPGRLHALILAVILVGTVSALFGIMRQTAQGGTRGFHPPTA